MKAPCQAGKEAPAQALLLIPVRVLQTPQIPENMAEEWVEDAVAEDATAGDVTAEDIRHLAGEWGMASGPPPLRHRVLGIRTLL